MWEELALQLPSGLEAAATVLSNEKVYILGGRDASGDLNTITAINMKDNTVEKVGTFNDAMCLHKACLW
jgi:N-acetylneuraminic acid mutarotase